MRNFFVSTYLLVFLFGCSVASYKYTGHKNSELTQIYNIYSKAVEATRYDNTRKWRNGAVGNIWINTFGGENYGLCYQWQNYIYKQTLSTIQDVGWISSGIVINKGTDWEHHAVIVYDPRKINKNKILDNESADQIYVLDPWRTGNADIYTLENWLKLPFIITVPASLEEVSL
jgi:hypothetical protein